MLTKTGSGYTPDTQLFVMVNGTHIGDLRADYTGAFRLILGTMPTAAPGAYIVAVSPAQATDSITTSASQATTGYMLDPAAPLRKVEPDSSATNITVPASISPLEGLRTYLPLVGR